MQYHELPYISNPNKRKDQQLANVYRMLSEIIVDLVDFVKQFETREFSIVPVHRRYTTVFE